MSTFNRKFNFRNNTEEEVIEKVKQQEIDFTLKIKDAVDVKLIDTDLYMSKELWFPWGARGVYGGQIVAQSLKAAWNTVDEDFFVHSLHAYFIAACDAETPLIYNIQRVRDGKSYATRIVKATQRGKAVFVCSCSFVKPDDSVALNHQTVMPHTVGPEKLASDLEILQDTLDFVENIPENMKTKAKQKIDGDLLIDSRPVVTLTPQQVILGSVDASTHSRRWFKTRGKLDDDMKLHACIIAYASDSNFIVTAAAASGYLINSKSIGMIASLDHTIWFHTSTARADKWLFYDVHSPRTSNGRGIAFGKIYSQDGTLVASTGQEGIVRLSEREQERRKKATAVTESKL